MFSSRPRGLLHSEAVLHPLCGLAQLIHHRRKESPPGIGERQPVDDERSHRLIGSREGSQKALHCVQCDVIHPSPPLR